jgi:hypothetical protein
MRLKRGGIRAATTRSADHDGWPEGTLGEWLQFLGARLDEPGWVPKWPPDAFALAAAFLRRTGAYVGLVNGTHRRTGGRSRTSKAAEEAGQEWRRMLDRAFAPGRPGRQARFDHPIPIQRWWGQLVRAAGRPLSECGQELRLAEAATNICIASDEASAGIGVVPLETNDGFLAVAAAVLLSNGRRSFCKDVPPEKLAVLGKQHTPQRGCTMRSLTHHLALYTPTEIQPFWEGPYKAAARDPDVFNLLLLPWPEKVDAGDFRVATGPRGKPVDGAGHYLHRYFDYTPARPEPARALARRVSIALDNAIRDADEIHGIVFPELSLTQEQFAAVEEVAVRRHAILIGGVRGQASVETNGLPLNACVIQPLGLTAGREDTKRRTRLWDLMRTVQFKHHRWCLDRNQILQYELGGRLPASHDCWEHIFIGPRKIHFMTLGSWLTLCVLICEDLARQDPVTEVIRAVGPNLVVALLMDGPQLRNRWPSRYASVLAEDPGCSVLSLTSLGMAKRSRPGRDAAPTQDRGTTIALWRDAVYGEREIALKPDHDACVLSLVCKTVEEFTIDGRGDRQQAHFPVYAGEYSFASQRNET